MKAGKISEGSGWKKNDGLKYLVPGIVMDGVISKSLLYTAGQLEEDWDSFELSWQSTLFSASVMIDLYTAYDAFSAEKKSSPRTAMLTQAAKFAASATGSVLLGVRLGAWVTGHTRSDLFQTRDVLNAIGLMFTCDDTPYLSGLGPEVLGYIVAGETAVKVAAGCLHIAAVVND